jgi:GTP pyrophosphokinase
VVGKDEYSLRNIEAVLRPPPEPVAAEEDIQQLVRKPRGEGPRAACWWWASIR